MRLMFSRWARLAAGAMAAIDRFHLLVREEKTALTIILSAGVLIRFVLCLGSRGILWPDSFLYYRQAANILKHHNLDAHYFAHTPLYPLFLAAFLFFGQTPRIGACIIVAQRVLGLLTTIFIYKTARRVVSPTAAFYAGILFTLHALQLYYETVVQTEVLFVFMVSATVYRFVVALEKPVWTNYVLLGVACAATALTRSVGQCFVILILGLLWWRLGTFRGILSSGVLIAGIYLVLVFPWMQVNHRVYGFWGLSKGVGANLFLRAIDIDHLIPPEKTDYPEVRKDYLRHDPRGHMYLKVFLELKKGPPRRSSPAADDQMFGFDEETVLAHPVAYVLGTFRQFYKTLAEPRESIHVCPSASGPFLGSGKSDPRTTPAFPSPQPDGHRAVRRAIGWYFRHVHVPMKPVLVFCLAGIVGCFAKRDRRFFPGVAVVVAILYFVGVTSLLNYHEDRFRLPVDGLIMAFAMGGVHGLWRWRPRPACGESEICARSSHFS